MQESRTVTRNKTGETGKGKNVCVWFFFFFKASNVWVCRHLSVGFLETDSEANI